MLKEEDRNGGHPKAGALLAENFGHSSILRQDSVNETKCHDVSVGSWAELNSNLKLSVCILQASYLLLTPR